MDKQKILIIGGSGLVGSRIIELLSPEYDFQEESLKTGFDITQPESVIAKIAETDAPVVLHLAAKADVDGCEKDKALGKEGDAWKINVEGTRNVVSACIQHNKKIMYISTDFVFGGEDTPEAGYSEENQPNPLGWYAETKYEGEKIVQSASVPWCIVRIAYPYRAQFEEKKDFVRVFKSLLEQGKQLQLITDHINSPILIDDIAIGLDLLIAQQATGIYHVTGSSAHSPYEEGILVAKTFGLDEALIGKTTRAEFFKDRAPRPFNLRMNNAKITALGAKIKTFKEGLEEVKRQLDFH